MKLAKHDFVSNTSYKISSNSSRYGFFGVLISLLSFNVAHAVETSCTPLNTAVFSSRVHIKCEESVAGIQYFALSTSDAAQAARVLSTISTATVAGRPVFVHYNPSDTSGAAIGCQVSDCRLIEGIGFWR